MWTLNFHIVYVHILHLSLVMQEFCLKGKIVYSSHLDLLLNILVEKFKRQIYSSEKPNDKIKRSKNNFMVFVYLASFYRFY